ncbi:MAG: HPr family phosphocarrier protein [bacterium]
MLKSAFIINNDAGLTGEIQTKIISLISRYQSNVDLMGWNGLRMNARHSGLVHIMRLRKGDKFFIQFDGPDEKDVSNSIVELFNGFNINKFEY